MSRVDVRRGGFMSDESVSDRHVIYDESVSDRHVIVLRGDGEGFRSSQS